MADDAFLGEIRIFPYDFIPQDWLECAGQIVSAQQYSGLYALIGNRFGGDPRQQKFALPNLTGAVGLGAGAGPGLPGYQLGQSYGAGQVALSANQIPPHQHALQRKRATGIAQKTNAIGPNSNLGQVAGIYGPSPADNELIPHMAANTAPTTSMAPGSIQANGSNQAHDNRQPFLLLCYAICVNGEHPARP